MRITGRQVIYNCMNFNVYLDDETGRALAALAKRRHTTRNALIRDAVRDWLARHGQRTWPNSVLEFTGDPEFEPFERRREELCPEADDPFAVA